ncbi:hypothetical protein NP493_525g03002 [Ridgeia piscesae]|uniref:CUB domain-containing protein n=1 Tax=Ridgeia piscesae TaxID=27915 RepID=A0AAD9KY05_RIDPI|nr:hypothetical protein NP493_525g03002 [Ridgeia piscesae]
MSILPGATAGQCGDNYVTLTDQGLSDQSAARYCGVELPPVYVSSASHMRIMFHGVSQPASGRRQGFLLTYRGKTSATDFPDTTAEPSSTGKGGLVCAFSHQILFVLAADICVSSVLWDHPCRT